LFTFLGNWKELAFSGLKNIYPEENGNIFLRNVGLSTKLHSVTFLTLDALGTANPALCSHYTHCHVRTVQQIATVNYNV